VTQSIPTHYTRIFLLQSMLIEELERMIDSF